MVSAMVAIYSHHGPRLLHRGLRLTHLCPGIHADAAMPCPASMRTPVYPRPALREDTLKGCEVL